MEQQTVRKTYQYKLNPTPEQVLVVRRILDVPTETPVDCRNERRSGGVESDVRVADIVGGDYGQPARDGGCFLCAFTGRACAIPMVEGRIAALAPPVNRDAEPTITLALDRWLHGACHAQ